MGRQLRVLKILVALLLCASYIACDGKAKDLSKGNYLGDAIIGDGDGERDDGDGSGTLYAVTRIVEASSDITSYTNGMLPFNGARQQLGQSNLNVQWPFEFSYTYPANNYTLNEARLFVVTSRDSSDTEAIFVDGVFTGRPPASEVSSVSPSSTINYRHYVCVGTCSGGAAATVSATGANTFFMDWALTHYKVATENTFDIDIANLLTTTPLTINDILSDGNLKVVTGDDAFIQTDTATASRPLLIMQGFTVSYEPLTCSMSPTYKLKNQYIHNDGNSIGQAAFTGTYMSPVSSDSSLYNSNHFVEFYFDPRLPTLDDYDYLDITTSTLRFDVRRVSSDPTAIVINGIGIDQDGFDRSSATTAVELWTDDVATRAAWNTFVNAMSVDNTRRTVNLDLNNLLGADTVKELLLQGKLNVSVKGPIANIYGAARTSTRTYGVQVNGPELILNGTYSAEICEVPDDPGSPLNGAGGGSLDCLVDTDGPIPSSIQVVSITSTSARIQWLTNEASTTRAGYGISAPSALTTEDTNLTTFHSVDLTNLDPYKYYQYNVRGSDSCGNSSISATRTFRTQR